MNLTRGNSREGVGGIGDLVAVALQLGAADFGGPLSRAEEDLVRKASSARADPSVAQEWNALILENEDPFGDELTRIRTVETRRQLGQFLTPDALVRHIAAWVLERRPARVVDVGSGTGRFASALSGCQGVSVIAIDNDAVSTLLTRARLAVLGSSNACVIHADYLTTTLSPVEGRTAFVGNPPYVRHHRLPAEVKDWGIFAARQFGLVGSRLSGLHALFFLATAMKAKPGDLCALLTSSEWFDVNYGEIVRGLFVRELGGVRLDVVPPAGAAFDDAMTTATVSFCEVGSQADFVEIRRLATPGEVRPSRSPMFVRRADLAGSRNWSRLLETGIPEGKSNQASLGRFFRVHRGVVTGANDFFVLSRVEAELLGLLRWCRPAITSAQEILESEGVIRDGPDRRLLLDIPAELDRRAHPELDAYLKRGESAEEGGTPICERYIARHRRPWWSVGHQGVPPVVVTYMARKPPAFATNPDGLALINVAHGIYPSYPLPLESLEHLVRELNSRRRELSGFGRTYQGGLQKLEPREVERLAIPDELVAELGLPV
jgi:SAM-dependent methyltransferase